MKWCNLYNCWCDDVKDVIDETYVEVCDYDCKSCDECEEILG